MERRWPEEAIDFEAAVRGALTRAGGVDLARRCEADPDLRATEVHPILDGLGLLDLDLRGGEAEAAAAALAAYAAGAVVCPWPLVQQLSVPHALRAHVDAVYLNDGSVRRVEHGDVAGRAAALDVVTGEVHAIRVLQPLAPMPLDPFGVPAELAGPAGPLAAEELDGVLDAHVVLAAFWAVGALGHARDLAARHARERRQFGRPIASFGGIQWHLSDIAVAHDGLWELASFNLGRLIDGRLTAADTLALQLTMLESSTAVLTHAHQILAATGLCEEHDLTVLNRHLQPLLRRPCGRTRVAGLLADEVARSGFDNLHPIHGAMRSETVG
jgi:acyl-CoA dehydrogenase